MIAIDKSLVETDISLGQMMAALDGVRDLPLVFSYGGRPVKPGYHATEVNRRLHALAGAGRFSSQIRRPPNVGSGEAQKRPRARYAGGRYPEPANPGVSAPARPARPRYFRPTACDLVDVDEMARS